MQLLRCLLFSLSLGGFALVGHTNTWPEDVPTVLSAGDVQVYQKMFRLQRALKRADVVKLIPKLDDELLMGHLVAERLLHPKTRTPYQDLQRWLSDYNDHPQAMEVYKLANRRAPKGQSHNPPKTQVLSAARYSDPDDTISQTAAANVAQESRKAKRAKERYKMIRRLTLNRVKGWYDSSLKQLRMSSVRELLGDNTWASAAVKLGNDALGNGKYQIAETAARLVMDTPTQYRTDALWVAGFAGYQQGLLEQSVEVLRELVYALPSNSRQHTRAAFWAAKVYEELNRKDVAELFYALAAENVTDFYGQLAHTKLGRVRDFAWRQPSLNEVDMQVLLEQPAVRRVIALAQIGEHALAQNELKAAYDQLPYDMDESLLALTLKINLPNTSFTLAHNLKEQHKLFLPGLYPVPYVWRPAKGYQVDPALLLSIIRQESAFDPMVVSRAGARGLMQLMPATAHYIQYQKGGRKLDKYRLHEPSVNLGLGQWYLQYLHSKLDHNLVYVLTAYNGGIGNLRKWLERGMAEREDPVLFIESIPFSETRGYVKKVMANVWIYRQQFEQPTPSLLAIAHNKWPVVQLALNNSQHGG